MAQVVNNLTASAGDIVDRGSIPGSGRSPAVGHGDPLHYSCLENPMDNGGWWATFHRVAHSQTRLKRLSRHTYIFGKYIYFKMVTTINLVNIITSHNDKNLFL